MTTWFTTIRADDAKDREQISSPDSIGFDIYRVLKPSFRFVAHHHASRTAPEIAHRGSFSATRLPFMADRLDYMLMFMPNEMAFYDEPSLGMPSLHRKRFCDLEY